MNLLYSVPGEGSWKSWREARWGCLAMPDLQTIILKAFQSSRAGNRFLFCNFVIVQSSTTERKKQPNTREWTLNHYERKPNSWISRGWFFGTPSTCKSGFRTCILGKYISGYQSLNSLWFQKMCWFVYSIKMEDMIQSNDILTRVVFTSPRYNIETRIQLWLDSTLVGFNSLP